MNITGMQDKVRHFPTTQINGAPVKSITQLLLERRATMHFKSDPVPDDYLEAILQLAAQAPSGYNLQPWRFVVVRKPENRARLQKAARDQAKVGEAPVVIVAFAVKDEWKTYIREIFREGVRRGLGTLDKVEQQAQGATRFLESIPPAVWLSRHTMIAFTTMMFVAEAYGLDTAPMEGFDPETVKREFGLPEQAEVIALLAIGFGQEPDKPYGGRFAVKDIVFREQYGRKWAGEHI